MIEPYGGLHTIIEISRVVAQETSFLLLREDFRVILPTILENWSLSSRKICVRYTRQFQPTPHLCSLVEVDSPSIWRSYWIKVSFTQADWRAAADTSSSPVIVRPFKKVALNLSTEHQCSSVHFLFLKFIFPLIFRQSKITLRARWLDQNLQGAQIWLKPRWSLIHLVEY
jgi:hypothetical protein